MVAKIELGAFDPRSGTPTLQFQIYGVRHRHPGITLVGILDTGFSGFIQLPLIQACSLNLPLEGTAKHTLADGSDVMRLTALAKVTVLEKTEMGVVSICSQSPIILLGMDFLRRFKGILCVSHSMGVVVLDQDEIDAAAKAAAAASVKRKNN